MLAEYGKRRLGDLYKEHGHQIRDLNQIIEIFSHGPTRYTTHALLRKITDEVLAVRGSPLIAGSNLPPSSIGVAHLLYRIGFLSARDAHDKTGLGFVRYEDRPGLLCTVSNLDDGLPWEIHPSYRQILHIRGK